MKNKVKHFISLSAIGLFLLFAIASGGPFSADLSTYNSVAISNCQDRPPVDVVLTINVLVVDEEGNPIENATCELGIIHQKVNPDTTCTYDVLDNFNVTQQTNASGHASYTHGTSWSHNNSEDLIRVQLLCHGSYAESYEGFQQVKVSKYANASFNFYGKVKSKKILYE